MRNMNEYLAKAPFDIYSLHLFYLVAETGSFTQAGEKAGLTQSAVTRQIKGMEERIGVTLFERTTRQVELTSAGAFLLRESRAILNGVSDSLQRLRESYGEEPKEIRVGVSRSIGLAHLPRFFIQFRRKRPDVRIKIVHESGKNLLEQLTDKSIDVGLLAHYGKATRGLDVLRRFSDPFVMIAPKTSSDLEADQIVTPRLLRKMSADRDWLLIGEDSQTGKHLRAWLSAQKATVTPCMELENFDLIVNLVALGMGVSVVPRRVLTLYLRRNSMIRLEMRPMFSRELVVVSRKARPPASLVAEFGRNIMY